MKPVIVVIALSAITISGAAMWIQYNRQTDVNEIVAQQPSFPPAPPAGSELRPPKAQVPSQKQPQQGPSPWDEILRAKAEPLPSHPDKQRERAAATLAYNQRTLAEAYERVSKKDPRWDSPAREAVGTAVQAFSRVGDQPTTNEDVYAASKKAVDVGCDDPLVLYLYARSSIGPNHPGRDESERRTIRAAKALESSRYPAVRRAMSLGLAGCELAERKNPTGEDLKEAARMLGAAARLLPEAYREDGKNWRAFQTLYETVRSCYQGQFALTKDRTAALDRVDAVLGQSPEVEVIRLQLRGLSLILSGWDARGTGFAKSVSDEGWRKFGAQLNEASEVLEKAWKLRPDDAQASVMMLEVEKGIGGDRDEMEKWFERAMQADDENYGACLGKLDWLDPKWHGEYEDLLAFGQACRESKKWKTGIPLLLAEAHFRIRCQLSADESRRYFELPAVWDGIREVYEEHLKHYPKDTAARSTFAAYAYLCERYAEAHQQFETLGANLVPSQHFPMQGLRQMKMRTAAAAGRDFVPPQAR
jgi:hypothetical protein